MDWQTYTAAGIVVITLVIFLVRMSKKSAGKPSCGHNCGCGKKRHPHKSG